MVNDPKLPAGLKFTHSCPATRSSDPQGVRALPGVGGSGGTLKKIPPPNRKDAHLEGQRFPRARGGSAAAARGGEGEREGGEGEREGGDAPSSLGDTHPLFSFAELAAQGDISNRQVYCLTGDRIKK